jgi:hypothetical protein
MMDIETHDGRRRTTPEKVAQPWGSRGVWGKSRDAEMQSSPSVAWRQCAMYSELNDLGAPTTDAIPGDTRFLSASFGEVCGFVSSTVNRDRPAETCGAAAPSRRGDRDGPPA